MGEWFTAEAAVTCKDCGQTEPMRWVMLLPGEIVTLRHPNGPHCPRTTKETAQVRCPTCGMTWTEMPPRGTCPADGTNLEGS